MKFPEKMQILLLSKQNGLLLSNISLSLLLFAESKNDYHIVLPNSDINGTIEINEEYLDHEIYIEASTAIMDYSSNIEHCKPIIQLSVLSMEQIISIYKAGLYNGQRSLYPKKYKMLELSKNYTVQKSELRAKVTENTKVQIIKMVLEEIGTQFNTTEIKELEGEDISIIAGYGTLAEFKEKFSKVDINRKNKFGLSLLHAAIAGQKYDIASFLINENANVNITDSDGMTPLHYISLYPDLIFAQKLLDAGADINIRDVRGNNAFLTAAIFGNNKKELLNYFIKFSPELKPNNSGFTPLSIAKQKGDMFLLKLLDKLNSC